MDQVDVVVIGAGVVGAAVAQRLSRKHSVVVLEQGPRPAEGITSRNSGVIHSSLYYPPGSLKAKLCTRGKELLYTWVREKEVPYRMTGKAVIAVDVAEEEQMELLYKNAVESGATGLKRWTRSDLDRAFTDIRGKSALFASETGIVDPYALTRSLLDDAEASGCLFLNHAGVTGIEIKPSGYVVVTERGPIEATSVVNSAGLYADEVARMAGIGTYRIHPWRGDYFRLRSSQTYPHLVYPIKAKGAAGLGIHLTLDLAGGLRLGPDVELGTSKEDFSAREEKLEAFWVAAQKLLGPLRKEQLSYDQCGIRPKLRAPSDKDDKDFVISQDRPGFVNLVGIESPGLTSSLAIAEQVEKLL